MSIVLVGTKATENPLNEEDSDSYKHVTVFKPMAVPNIQLLESIDEIEAESAQGDGIPIIIQSINLPLMLHSLCD
jgi:hypothetical protein